VPHRYNRRLLCGAAAIAISAMASIAHAEDKRDFNIAPQPLATALMEFGAQSGVAIVVPGELTATKTTHGVTASVEPELALQTILAGTGLTYRREGELFAIVLGASDPQSGSAAGDGADQGTVQALIVTAQKREENIQDVPIAMSAFTQEDLTRSQVAGGPDLMTQIPNFTFTKTNFTGYSIQIRGIGTQAVSATVDPAVAVAFNNTPFIRNRFFEQEFYDLDRVEVLRGPQGTLYGRNATAGVVNIISAKPKNHFEAKLSADVSNYDSSRLEGMINIPLVEDKAALRIAGAWTKRDGFVTNTIDGEQTDGRDLWSARVTLGLTPVDWFRANLIYEHFSENDDRLRSGKQLCHTDPGPASLNGLPISDNGDPVFGGASARVYWTQGCLPASLYSPDSFQTPNGFALPYGPAASLIGAPISTTEDPYVSRLQSRNLREIETRLKPDYEASNDTVELQLQFDLPGNLTLASETGFNHDLIFSFEDFNRFNTRAGIFIQDRWGVQPDGSICDPQLGCSDRMAVGDLSTAKSLQFSQEFRLSSNYEGPVNFSLGANFLRYDTEDKYYVFFNTLFPGVSGWSDNTGAQGDMMHCFFRHFNGADTNGYAWSNPTREYGIAGFNCSYYDPNDIHHLNDEGRNYFLSKNPYHLLSYAAFGEVYWQVTPNLKVTGGFRWTDDRKTAPQIPSWTVTGGSYGTPTLKVIEQEWKEPTGRLAIDWKPQVGFTDETLLYASYVHGYKAGGANPPGYVVTGAPACPPSCGGAFGQDLLYSSITHPETFKPEFVDAYEVGTKNTLLDGRLTFNLNAFYYDYTGYQISQIVDRSAVNLNFDAKIWGSELEVDWRPLENLRLGFKGGYEKTRMADGSRAIDLIDRTAGMPGWIVQRPFPTFPSNCVAPTWLVTFNDQLHAVCFAYPTNTDPATWLPYVPNPTEGTYGADVFTHWGYNYPGFDPETAPNHGEGFTKDLSGNELPNAPHFTATITADYTIPLPADWLVTLHTDLYYQSEAWTRVFNTPGYDKLKAYNNINLAAIFSDEDRGWTVMAYIKNVLDKDNITGAFLNSDDTGLTTNVFLNEPRLYGLRVTKQWSGGGRLGDLFGAHTPGQPYPFTLETEGYYGRFGHGHERFAPPYSRLFNADFPMPDDGQSDLDQGGGGGVRLTYAPAQGPWSVSASIRYGRAVGQATPHAQQALGVSCITIFGTRRLCRNPSTGEQTLNGEPKYDAAGGKYNFYDAAVANQESHANADFMIGRDFGLGSASEPRMSSTLRAGLAYARVDSSTDLVMHVRPDIYVPAEMTFPPQPPLPETHLHRLNAEMQAHRQFTGAGPSLMWDSGIALTGDTEQSGRIGVDVGLGASVLFGRQIAQVREHLMGAYTGAVGFGGSWDSVDFTPPYDTTLTHNRSKSATVPVANARLGLSYELGRLKLSGGYRWERYFNVIDAGVAERKTYDRQFDGPYMKVSIGFGG